MYKRQDLGRRAAHAAVRAAQEAAKQVATEIARGTAERTARSAAQESARSVAEQAAREVSEGVSQRNVARSLELNREELLKELETQIDQQSKANLTLLTANPEFKQQLVQTVRSGIQPVICLLYTSRRDRPPWCLVRRRCWPNRSTRTRRSGRRCRPRSRNGPRPPGE